MWLLLDLISPKIALDLKIVLVYPAPLPSPGLIVSFPCLTLLPTSSLPGFAASYCACFVSGPPAPSKSRAFVGLAKR